MVFCNTLNSSRAVDHFLTENQISTVNYHGEVPAVERFVIYNFWLCSVFLCITWYMTSFFLLTIMIRSSACPRKKNVTFLYIYEIWYSNAELRTWTSSVTKRGIAQLWYALIWQLEAWTWRLTMSSCLTSHRIRYAVFVAVRVFLDCFCVCIYFYSHRSDFYAVFVVVVFLLFRLIIFTEPGELHAWEPKV